MIGRIDRALAALPFYGPDGLLDTFDRSEAALREAKIRQQRDGGAADVLVAQLLGEQHAVDPIPALQAAVDEADRRLNEARGHRSVLEDERRTLEGHLKDAQSGRYGAVCAVLKSDEAVAALFAEHDRLRDALLAVRAKIRALGPGGIPQGREAWSDPRAFMLVGTGEKDEAWTAAIAALEADASASLP